MKGEIRDWWSLAVLEEELEAVVDQRGSSLVFHGAMNSQHVFISLSFSIFVAIVG